MSAGLHPPELIRKKRDGGALSAGEIQAFMDGVIGGAGGAWPDEQVAAMLMAVFFRGLGDAELGAWADAMLHSGDVLDLSDIDRPKIDKHSTGGVGDKISLPLAAAVAACGVAVPMVSGRGLGHTGGTLDKLESIPGFRVDLSVDRFRAQVAELGVCLIGQTERIAPADRRLYALRDVTATVESIPLIASSIMSKKLAEGIDGLVLDCKVGRGAFMNTLDDARALGRAIRVIGHSAGKHVTVMFTDMNAPIGRAVGNALEVAESVEVLRGGGPADTRELTVRLGAEMLRLAGLVEAARGRPDAARDAGRDAATDAADAEFDAECIGRIERVLDDGSALDVFRRLVAAQGGDPRVVDDPAGVLPQAPHTEVVTAARAGVIESIGARDVGLAAMVLGAGRVRKNDEIDPAVGVILSVRVGDRVEVGQPVATLHHAERGLERARALLLGALAVSDAAETSDHSDRVSARSRMIEVLR